MGSKTFKTIWGYHRTYPKTVKSAKTVSVFGSLYFIMMVFVPGSELPFQKSIKISILNFSQFFSKGWYYNFINPEPEIYLIKINQILLAAIDMQVFDVRFIDATFKEVRDIFEVEKKQMSKSAFWDILIYSEIILQNIIRYQKRLLIDKDIFQHYEWLLSTLVLQNQSRNINVSQKRNFHINLIFTVVQYLINFGEEKSKEETIYYFYKLIKDYDPNSQTQQLSKRILEASIKNKQFIQSLKQIYNCTSQQQLKLHIINIFDKIDIVYQQNSLKSVSEFL